MKISIIVPAFNAQQTLIGLLESIFNQTYKDFELIIVDDGSTDTTATIANSANCKLIRLQENHGPAYCRNLGVRSASGDILAFTDSDCKINPEWLANINRHFSGNDFQALMGKLILLPSSALGNSISALGYPAGGSVGFDKIWKVDEKGFTKSLSTCNCAVTKDTFDRIGGFDEAFPYPGGEDSLLAYRLNQSGYKIKYCKDVIAYHPARESLQGFLKWQFRRGISGYIFAKKVDRKKGFLLLRIWSTVNIIRHNCLDYKFPLIFLLLCSGYLAQILGLLSARYNKEYHASFDH